MPSNSVSIIVPAYNCAATIFKTISALLNQKYPEPFELIVIDDGSTDESAALIKSFPQVRYIYQPNAGPAAARNKGAELAGGIILFFTDSDCIPQDNWIAKMMVHFQDPKVAAVAGSYGIANPNSPLAQAIHQEILFRHHKLMPRYPKAFGSYNVALRREIFKKVGGFNESYRYASGEDNDLSYKISKAGYKIYFEREALVDHYHPENLKRYLSEQFRHGYWRMKMYRDHPDMAIGDDYTFFKDIIEVPLAFLSLAGLILGVVFYLPFWALAATVILFGLEIFYSFFMIKDVRNVLRFSIVMFLRAYSRLFGFLSALPAIFRFSQPKKV